MGKMTKYNYFVYVGTKIKYLCLGIPPQLEILEHGNNDVSLDVEPGRSLNLTCQSEGEHAGNVKWTNQGRV